MHIVGLTGGIASGKSTVSSMLAELGCPVIDADVIAREVVEPGRPAWKLIIGHFGVDVLLPDGHIDRPKLASVIFVDEGKRHLLNMCTHPYIQSAMFWQVVRCFLRGEPFVVLVSPLLFESGKYLWILKRTVVVDCTNQQQIERLQTRDNISETEALQRIEAQLPLAEKCRRAHTVIDNSRDRDFTRQQVLRVFAEMRSASVLHRTFRWILLVLLFVIGFVVFSLVF